MRVMAFVRSLLLLVVFVIAVPWGLLQAASLRFGGRSPWSGVPSPGEWQRARLQAALTDRLTEATIADIVIRVSLGVAWIAVATIVVTVVAELRHMARHQGLPMPDMRGLAIPQQIARVIAVGLLVAIPLVGSSARATASDTSMLRPTSWQATSHVSGEQPGAAVSVPQTQAIMTTSPMPVQTARVVHQGVEIQGVIGVEHVGAADPPARAEVASAEYVVKAGDSIYGIAGRLAGPGATDVAEYAERILDLNLGRTMPDGHQFNNAAFIDVGWTLQLPGPATSTGFGEIASDVTVPVAAASSHVVEANESLWSIAEDELGDGHRWTEVFTANEGRVFGDGRTLADPALIRPGWELAMPGFGGVPRPTVTTVESGSVLPGAEPASEELVEADSSVTAETPPPEFTAPAVAPASAVPRVVDVVEIALDPSSLPPVAASAQVDRTPGSEVASAAEPAVVNSWQSGPLPGEFDSGNTGATDVHGESSVPLVTLARSAMLGGGVLLLLAARRRQRLRAARPRARIPDPAPSAVTTERQLRAIGGGERFARVDLAVRAAAPALAERGARVAAVLIAADGTLELWATGPANLHTPWRGIGDRWSLPGDVPLEALAPEARRVVAPTPTLVQLGVQRGAGRQSERDVYVDLEAIGAIEVGGSGAQADSIVVAIASTLASSVLAEVTTLIGVGVPDEAFLGHRLHVGARDIASGFAAAADAVGSLAHHERTTFDLRVHATGGDTWEPAVMLVGASVGDVPAPTNRTGLALVSGSAIVGPSSRLTPDGDAWVLRPLGLRFVPIGITEADLQSLVELIMPVELEDFDELADAMTDHTIMGRYDDSGPVDDVAAPDDDATVVVPRVRRELDQVVNTSGDSAADDPVDGPATPAILVRLLGPVSVESAVGETVDFERSKTKELLAWMVTHRERSTRSLARTALWDLDVRNATFANVVSEARRALARLVEPSEGEEWVGRTLTESLPLHACVRSDADVLTDALRVARVQPPAQAIATLTPAVGLIRGMPFEGAPYLWPDPEGIASNLVLLATTAAGELAAHCLSVGDVEGVFAATARGLSVLSGHEELIGLRMRAHGDAGDLAGVRMEWDSYSRALLADPWSDGEPSPKLVTLRTELLTGASRA